MKKNHLISVFVLAFSLFVACSKDSKEKESHTDVNKIPSAKDLIENKKLDSSSSAFQKNSDDTFQYQFRLEVGKNYPYSIRETENLERFAQAGTEKKRQSLQNQSLDVLNFKCIDFKNDIYTLEVSILRKFVKVTGDGKSKSVDTQQPEPTNPEDKKMWSIQKSMVGGVFTMKMNKDGKVLDVNGLDKMYSKISSSLKDVLKPDEIQELIKGVKETLNKEAFAQQFEGTLVEFPKGGAKIGQRWQVTNKKNPKNSVSYTLKSVSDKGVEIAVESSVPKKSKSETKNGVTMTATAEGSQQGIIILDKTSGWIKSAKLTTKMSEKMVLTDGKNTETQGKSVVSITEINP